jgi:hypothetical protein
MTVMAFKLHRNVGVFRAMIIITCGCLYKDNNSVRVMNRPTSPDREGGKRVRLKKQRSLVLESDVGGRNRTLMKEPSELGVSD